MKSLKTLITVYLIGAVLMAATPAALACSRHIATNQLGDNQMYSCTLVAESVNYCYYECTQVGGIA